MKIDETLKKEEARERALLEVKMYQSNGWDIREETPEYFLLKRNTASFGGHLLVFLFTFWLTVGLGNIIYWAAKRESKKIIK